MRIVREIGLWMWAVISAWYGWVGASATAGMIGFGQGMKWWESPSKSAYIAIIVSGFVISVFQAWVFQHRRADVLANKVEELTWPDNRPKLSLDHWGRIELDGKYSIQVPDGLTLRRVSETVSSIPRYFFDAEPAQSTFITILVMPFTSDTLRGEHSNVRLPIEFDDILLTGSFKISGDEDAYYGWRVSNNAYECRVNKSCMAPDLPESRYITQYVFAVFDKTSNLTVEFTGYYFGPSKEVTTFKGEGKLLRDIIIPSLTRIH